MEFDRFFKFSQLLLRDEFVLSYSGYVSEDILLAVGDTLRARLEDHARDGAQIRNVFSTFVELMQNIIRYGVTIKVKNDRGQGRAYQRRRDTNSKQLRE